MGWLMLGRKVGKRKFSWKYRKTREIISKVTVSLSLTIYFNSCFDQHCCLSSLNSLSNLFSQYKISLCWINTNDVSSFIALAKNVAASQHKRWRKNLLWSFWHQLGHESARAPLCNLAICRRQLFLSEFKLLQTWQTGRKNKKQSKAEIGYD